MASHHIRNPMEPELLETLRVGFLIGMTRLKRPLLVCGLLMLGAVTLGALQLATASRHAHISDALIKAGAVCVGFAVARFNRAIGSEIKKGQSLFQKGPAGMERGLYPMSGIV